MARQSRYSPEVRERAIRMVREHGAEHPSQWAVVALQSTKRPSASNMWASVVVSNKVRNFSSLSRIFSSAPACCR